MRQIKLLSYNIQSAVGSSRYRDYVTRSWRHVVPNRDVRSNLDRIAELIAEYDIVAIQEIDAGSIRSGFINQLEYLAGRAGFSHAHTQVNRNLGPLAQQSIGLLSRHEAYRIQKHALPGRIPGRGALFAHFGTAENDLMLVVTHLALGKQTRHQQMCYLQQQLAEHPQAILMGDTNCNINDLLDAGPLAATNLRAPDCSAATFPSWNPQRRLDHILVSQAIKLGKAEVLLAPMSDHLPVALEIELPADLAQHWP